MSESIGPADCVIVSVPPILLLGPHLAPALLKAVAARHGYRVVCFDPSPRLFAALPPAEKERWPYNELETVYADRASLAREVDGWLDEILAHRPRIIGLSTHAWASAFFIDVLSERIRARAPQIRIIIGGPIVMEIGAKLKASGTVDHFVIGDGEEAFTTLLAGRTDHPNIDGRVPVPVSNEVFGNLPVPDFSDSKVEYYKTHSPGGNRIYLVGSRGCVFNCSFCNVPSMTVKYRFKDGAKFAREIISVQKQYSPKFIELGDSLTNSSLREFRKLCEELVRLKAEEDVHPRIVCFFRMRGRERTQEEDFRLAAAAGIHRLKIGVESGSAAVRGHMGKQETNEDVFHTLALCLKYGINVNLLLIAGYVTETEEMFQETLTMLREIKARGLDRAVEMVVVNELYISAFTPLDKYARENGIQMDSPSEWTSKLSDGTLLDRAERLRRVAAIKDYALTNFSYAKKVLTFSSDEKSSVEGVAR